MNNAKLIDAPNIRPAREKTGSTDFGNVMYVIPGSCIRISFVDENASSHSQEFLDEGKTKRGHDAIIHAAKIVAGTAFDLIDNPSILNEVKKEFDNTKAKMSIV
ncbi:hypothetical protein SDC9_100475 [bioreactor metagenome]|uniref:p-aminobenzoyl-glutamate hydrolase subunit B n=1 Tax=bioreactor metagenome TaxID=1076179 RepID=A0A645ALA3_9ZZZZ